MLSYAFLSDSDGALWILRPERICHRFCNFYKRDVVDDVFSTSIIALNLYSMRICAGRLWFLLWHSFYYAGIFVNSIEIWNRLICFDYICRLIFIFIFLFLFLTFFILFNLFFPLCVLLFYQIFLHACKFIPITLFMWISARCWKLTCIFDKMLPALQFWSNFLQFFIAHILISTFAFSFSFAFASKSSCIFRWFLIRISLRFVFQIKIAILKPMLIWSAYRAFKFWNRSGSWFLI